MRSANLETSNLVPARWPLGSADHNATETGFGVEPSGQLRRLGSGEQSPKEGQVHPARQFKVTLRDLVERAVEEANLALMPEGDISGVAQHRLQRLRQSVWIGIAPGSAACLEAELTPVLLSDGVQCLWTCVRGSECVGEEVGGDLETPLG
jgi:hypothetical protein